MDNKKITIIYWFFAIIFMIATPFLLLANTGVKMFASKVIPIAEILLFVSLLGFYITNVKGSNGGKLSDKEMVLGKAKFENKKNLKNFMGDDGVIIGKNFRLNLKKSFEHILILGPTGSGKSSSFFKPNLLDLKPNVSALISDPKGELYKETKNYNKSIGKTSLLIQPLKLKHDFFYNPLFLCETKEEIDELARIILMNGGKAVGDDNIDTEWINMSTPLFTSALIYVKENNKYASISEAVDLIQFTDAKKLEEILESNPKSNRYYAKFKAAGGSPKTASSIKTVIATNTQIFERDDIRDFIKTPMKINENGEMIVDEEKLIIPNMLREKDILLFFSTPEMDSKKVMPLMAVIYSQVFEKIMRNKEGNPVLCFLDEFANIGIINGIEQVATTGRTRGVSLNLGIQNIEQLEENYGKNGQGTLLTNLKTKVAFPGLTGDSAEYISGLSGDTTVKVNSGGTSESGNIAKDLIGGNRNKNYNYQSKKLLTTNDVRTLADDKLIVVFDNKNITFDNKVYHYKTNPYKIRYKM